MELQQALAAVVAEERTTIVEVRKAIVHMCCWRSRSMHSRTVPEQRMDLMVRKSTDQQRQYLRQVRKASCRHSEALSQVQKEQSVGTMS